MNVDKAKRVVRADVPAMAVTHTDIRPITAGRVLATEVERLQELLSCVQRRVTQGEDDPTHGDDLWDRVAKATAI